MQMTHAELFMQMAFTKPTTVLAMYLQLSRATGNMDTFQVRQALATNDVGFPIPAAADIAIAFRLSGN